MSLRIPRPLYELGQEAPLIPRQVDADLTDFKFSNDDSIASFQDAWCRVESPEYQNVRNKVTVVVGEGALHTNIQYLPEQTIVMVGNEPEQVKYMDYYTFIFQTARDQKEWITATGPRSTGLVYKQEVRALSQRLLVMPTYLNGYLWRQMCLYLLLLAMAFVKTLPPCMPLVHFMDWTI
jgi:hypothetical protein